MNALILASIAHQLRLVRRRRFLDHLCMSGCSHAQLAEQQDHEGVQKIRIASLLVAPTGGRIPCEDWSAMVAYLLKEAAEYDLEKRGTRVCAARVMKALRPPPEATNLAADLRTSPATKVAQLQLWHYYRSQIEAGRAPNLCDTGFRCFSQFDEDGLILFIIAALGISQGVFLDIGAADGINSNCANLALNFGWRGTFIDGNKADIAKGRAYYERHPDTWLYPPTFIHCMVNRENINQTLVEASVPPDVDLMSIDIDGNDYWIWEAITATSPKVVIIETHIEFGFNNIVVPYDKDHVYPGLHPDYFGASPIAMERLARRKGYRR
jgi:hypothetical protein